MQTWRADFTYRRDVQALPGEVEDGDAASRIDLERREDIVTRLKGKNAWVRACVRAWVRGWVRACVRERVRNEMACN